MGLFESKGGSESVTDTGVAVDINAGEAYKRLWFRNDGANSVFVRKNGTTASDTTDVEIKINEVFEFNLAPITKFYAICSSGQTATLRWMAEK
jgi:hypothetical protein